MPHISILRCGIARTPTHLIQLGTKLRAPCPIHFRVLCGNGWESTNPNIPPSTPRNRRVPHISILRCGIARTPTHLIQLGTKLRAPCPIHFRVLCGNGWESTNPNIPPSTPRNRRVPHISILRCGIARTPTHLIQLGTKLRAPCPIHFRVLCGNGWESTNPNIPPSTPRNRRVPHISILRCGIARTPTHLIQLGTKLRAPCPIHFRVLCGNGWESTNPNIPPSTPRNRRVPHISILRCGIARTPTHLIQLGTKLRAPSISAFFAEMGGRQRHYEWAGSIGARS